jgi:hypothetical protein
MKQERLSCLTNTRSCLKYFKTIKITEIKNHLAMGYAAAADHPYECSFFKKYEPLGKVYHV